MTDQEKNEVLARWAGFTPGECKILCCQAAHWLSPDNTLWHGVLPDFLHSLDAQAKWLWPKLEDWGIGLRGDGSRFFGYASLNGVEIQDSGTTPAEACAEAILSLIGKDNASS